MKAHLTDRVVDINHPEYLNAKERRVASRYINEKLREVLPKIATRSMMVVFIAMMDAGYKASSINNVINHMPYGLDLFDHYQKDNSLLDDIDLGDEAMYLKLRDYGVHIECVKEDE